MSLYIMNAIKNHLLYIKVNPFLFSNEWIIFQLFCTIENRIMIVFNWYISTILDV